jgi:hypothetical protein
MGQGGRNIKMTTRLCLVLRLLIIESLMSFLYELMALGGIIYLKLGYEQFILEPQSLTILSFDATTDVIKETYMSK